MSNKTIEITADGMRCLLRAIGYESDGRDDYFYHREYSDIDSTVKDFVVDLLADEVPWFVLAALRFLESKKVRAAGIKTVAYNGNNRSGAIPNIHAFSPNPDFNYVFSDPDPAVRVVRAAIAAARELESGK